MKEHFADIIFNSIPCYTSEFIPENTVVIMNKKTGANKIIDYEETVKELESQITSLKSQLANIKYLSEYEIDKAIFGQMDYDEYGNIIDFNANKAAQAICKLAIPEDDFLDKLNDYIKANPDKVINQIMANVGVNNFRDKIVEVLDSRFKTQLRMYLIELYSVTGKLTEKQENDIKDYMKKSADEIIKAIRGEE